jgi:hypothetical protein
MRRYRAANPEKVREERRAYRAANPEKVREERRRYRAANPEKAREQKLRYTRLYAERNRQKRRWYRAENIEKENERARERNRQCRIFIAAARSMGLIRKGDTQAEQYAIVSYLKQIGIFKSEDLNP